MAERSYPQTLAPVRGPLPEELALRAVQSLGPRAKASQELYRAGLVAPNVLAGLSLFLLVGQPRGESSGGRSGGVSGGVWVREQYTVHRPVRFDEELVVSGEVARQYVHKGRRYSVTTAQTRDADGVLVAENCTTGLLQYRADPDLADEEQGRSDTEIVRPAPDAAAVRHNPCLAALRAVKLGDQLAGPRAEVTLDLMRQRDGERSRNPIHTDPEAARRAGLGTPIAGGSHVMAFAHELLMDAWGPEVLLHGTSCDTRWKAPVHAGTQVEPSATVVRADPQLLEVELTVLCEGATAMVGRLSIPLAG
jgi:acyl dehydratase